MKGYVELATICAFSRMLGLLNLPPNQKSEEIPNAVIKKVRHPECSMTKQPSRAVHAELPGHSLI